METYRAAIIGLGRMGSTIDEEVKGQSPIWEPYSIAGAVGASERLELVAGADILPERREAFTRKWGVAAVYEDYGEMIRQEQPDLVAICTRGHLHAEMAVGVAEAGVPMLYQEKAMACSMREADAVLDACRRHGTVFNTGVLNCFNPWYQAAREVVASGQIGEPRVAVHYADRDLLHGHTHTIGTLSYLLGDPKIEAVRGELHPRDLRIEGNRLEQDPHATFQLRFANGVEGWTLPAGVYEFEVIGAEGAVRLLNNGSGMALRRSAAPGGRRAQWDPAPIPPVVEKSMVVTCLEDLMEAHEAGRRTRTDVETTHNTTEACFAVPESHLRGGTWVELPLENRDLYVFHR